MNKLDPFDGDDSDQDAPSGAAVNSSGSATALHNQKVWHFVLE